MFAQPCIAQGLPQFIGHQQFLQCAGAVATDGSQQGEIVVGYGKPLEQRDAGLLFG